MNISVTFPGGKRVDAAFGDRVVATDQSPAHGGEGSAPEPFELFLASLATCAGIYVLGFCQARGIPTDGIRVEQHAAFDEAGKVLTDVIIDVHLPDTFPEKYRTAVVAAANNCKVKKVIASPPRFEVKAIVARAAA
jgi:ribosomal protein S12 methylthiotransferase accessory factor